MPKKPKTKKRGVVRKIIQRYDEPEKAEISIEGADDLYKEIRIENALETDEGGKVKLTQGAPVDVVVEADEKDTTSKTK